MKGWKTYLFNGGVIILAVTDYFSSSPSLITSVFGEAKGAIIVAGISAVNMVLRTVTTTPPFKDCNK